jgi:hypothetical protein
MIDRRWLRGLYAVLIGLVLLGTSGREAWADPLFTVTDLGTSSVSLLSASTVSLCPQLVPQARYDLT